MSGARKAEPTAAQLVKNARAIRGATQHVFARELRKDQSVLSKYERGLVLPPADVLMHCMNIVHGDAPEAMSPDQVAKLVVDRLGPPEFTRLRVALAALIQSVPSPSPKKRLKARRGV
jgi:transcriptional regulator with XRE-family HTH domain